MKRFKLLFWGLILVSNDTLTEFSRVIIWGHKLYSHTHSFIHYGFHKGFKYLGYEVHWLDHSDDLSNLDLRNSLFITEGQVDIGVPLRSDCSYVLHNCDPKKYHNIPDQQKLLLQVYINDCENRNCQKFAPCVLYNLNQRIIYMPWATDLLPHEIDAINLDNSVEGSVKTAVYVGAVGDNVYGNLYEVETFKKACDFYNIEFSCEGLFASRVLANSKRGAALRLKQEAVSNERGLELVKRSYLAPAIQGKWQCGVGYIPCRIFKNISYGKLGVTNNPTVYNLFNKKIVYNSDCYQLGIQAAERMKTITDGEIREQMNFVRDNHTYLNRINCILKMFDLMAKNDF